MTADPRRRRASPVLVLALALAFGGVACSGASELQFIDDGSLTITFPPDRSVVSLPLVVRWEAVALVDGQRYGVFVDRTPQRPGDTIEAAFDVEDRAGIHVVDEPRITLEQVAIRGGVPSRESDQHEVTVVVLDAQGRRVGERAAVIAFEVHRGSP